MNTTFSIKLLILLAIIVVFSSCNGKTDVALKERDSIALENRRLNEFLDIVAFSMDSINGQERYLYMTKDGTPITNKEQIRNNIKLYQYTLDEQRARIADLEKQLAAAKGDKQTIRKLQAIINGLEAQIEEKDSLIARLNEELEQKNFNIIQLRSNVKTLSGNIESLSEQVNQLTTQANDAEVNLELATKEATEMSYGYVLVGTKKQLSSLGVLKGGFLKKSKVELSNVDNGKFQRVDIRSFSHISIPGNNVKIMTSHPSSSYSIEEGLPSVLYITNPSLFWNTSRYLIVQYK